MCIDKIWEAARYVDLKHGPIYPRSERGDMPVSSRTEDVIFFALKIGQGHGKYGQSPECGKVRNGKGRVGRR